jgi:hypothetical protein
LRTLQTDTTFFEFALIGVPIGLGVGVFQSPNNSAIMGSVPRAYAGVAGGMLTLTRLLGQITGIAILGSFWAARVTARASATGAEIVDAAAAEPAIQVAGLHDTTWVMAALALLAAGIGWWGLRRERELTVPAEVPSI